MKELIIVNFEEIFLKGENQKYFVRKLRDQLKFKLKHFSHTIQFKQTRGGSLFLEITEPLPESDIEKIKEILQWTPGITQFYFVKSVPSHKDLILQTCVEIAEKQIRNKSDFRITARRLDKTFPFTSRELAMEAGASIVEKFGTKVNLTNPDYTIYIKVRPEQTFVYDEIIQGIGGLPVGTSGRAYAFLSGGIDSPVAAFMGINRGLEITALHFHSVPKTSPKSIEKVKQLANRLAEIQGKLNLLLIPVLKIQQAIAQNTDSKLRLILLRRFFLKIAEKLSEESGIKTVITGDSLGQVASQTLENIIATQAASNLFMFRPLIALDKKYIIQKARAIGTYDISILPHDDACALFTPKKPETRANLSYVENQWEKLNVEKLVDQALSQREELLFEI